MKQKLITLTDLAAQKAKEFLARDNKKALRLDVNKGGCSGFMYEISLENEPRPDDASLEDKEITIFLGKEGQDFMKGSTVDFTKSLQETGFKIINPNVKHTCKCGHSIG